MRLMLDILKGFYIQKTKHNREGHVMKEKIKEKR
jgi:hypothetical protein